ncbi:MAG: hypothetical protein AB8G16_13440 [Gammaproteobacteria bacterium]
MIAWLGLEICSNALGLPRFFVRSNYGLIAVNLLEAVLVFMSTSIAALIGSKRVVLPMILLQCLGMLFTISVATKVGFGRQGADIVLAGNLPGYAMSLFAVLLGGLVGHYLFLYRRRPRSGSGPIAP